MDILSKTDEEIFAIGKPFWENLVRSSNMKDYDHKGNVIIECNKKYFRPSEVQTLLGNPIKAKRILKWKPKISVVELAKEMIQNDLKLLSKDD